MKACGRGSLRRAVASSLSTMQEGNPNLQKACSLADINSGKYSKQKTHGRGQILAEIMKDFNDIKIQPASVQSASKILQSQEFGLGRGNFLMRIARQCELREQRTLKQAVNLDKHKNQERCVPPKLTPYIQDEIQNLPLENAIPSARRGSMGEKFNVTTNYVALTTDQGKSVFEFHVSFLPEIHFVGYRSKLINLQFKSKKGIRCYDGGTKLYLPNKITEDELIIEAQHPNDDSPVTISIKYKRQMTLGECVHLYNILFYNCAKVLKYARLGRESYDFRLSHQIPQYKLEIWPGYVTSVKQFEGGLLLCCDIKHRVLRTETAYDVLTNIVNHSPNNVRTLALRELIGQCVLTRYNNNLYRIDDIDWNQTPMNTFKLSSGKDITFLEYYRQQYNIQITDVKQPLLLSKLRTKTGCGEMRLIYLVPEICNMTGLTDTMRNDVLVMKDIANYTRITPSQRNFSFKKFLTNIRNNSHAQEILQEWGLNIAEHPLETEARILPSEKIFFHNKSAVTAPINAIWANCFKSQGLFRSTDLKNWLLVYTIKETNLANKFKEALKKVGPGLGIEILNPNAVLLKSDKIDCYISSLKENITSSTQIVVCLCPTPRTDRYSAIKKFCCQEVPIPSQIINSCTLKRDSLFISIVQNVALQINNKLGGASWALHIPLKNCMVCGIDTFHEYGFPSVGGFVASIDTEFTKWFSRACIQEPRQELLDGLVHCFTTALQKYFNENKTLPDRIVIYRDGVGEGMLPFIYSYEVQQFLDACKLQSTDYMPRLSFVVVSKKINTKFYDSMDKSGNICNPKPGSVLDHTITRQNCYNFFLVSQHVSCGTAMPSHYMVLYDNSDLKPDFMQRLTYKFCHLYFNWPGTVRVPAPCLYAHKLAYLVGQHIKGHVSSILENQLYYL